MGDSVKCRKCDAPTEVLEEFVYGQKKVLTLRCRVCGNVFCVNAHKPSDITQEKISQSSPKTAFGLALKEAIEKAENPPK